MFCSKVILFFSLCVVFCESQYYDGDNCYKNGVQGVCRYLSQCKSARAEILAKRQPQLCSYDGISPIVCCVEKPPATKPPPIAEDDGGCEPMDPSISPPKIGQKSFDKCIDYQLKYVYPCEKSTSLFGDVDRSNHCNHKADDLIIGGTAAERFEFPHMALLGYEGNDNIEWLCGGAIISERYILTAGHCIQRSNRGNLTHVAIGIWKRSETADTSRVYKVKRIIKHPQYQPPFKYNDIALLETERDMSLNQFTVPACLHIGDTVNDTQAVVAGWGFVHNTNNNPISETLQKVKLSKYSLKECSRKFKPNRLLTRGVDESTQICFGDRDRPTAYQDFEEFKDTCQGDSGGPIKILNAKINCMYTIIGVTSFGDTRCGIGRVQGYPGIYTRVAHYVPWIESIVWPN